MAAGPHTVGVLNVTRHGTPDYAPQFGLYFGEDCNDTATVRGRNAEADANRLAACWNALAGLSSEQVERLGTLLARYNADEVEDFLRDEKA